MANNIFILPMDDRPCTYNFPKQLAEISGANVIIPPKEIMGNLDKVADTKKIVSLLVNKRYVTAGAGNVQFTFTQHGIDFLDTLKEQTPLNKTAITMNINSNNNSSTIDNSIKDNNNITNSHNTNLEHKEGWFKRNVHFIYYTGKVLAAIIGAIILVVALFY